MFTVELCGLALIQAEKLGLVPALVQGGDLGYLWTTLEIVIFGGLVWALVSSRANEKKTEADQFAQRLRARQKELTLK